MQNPNAIECISVDAVEIPFTALGSRWAGREKPQCLDSTVVIVETRAGTAGCTRTNCPGRASSRCRRYPAKPSPSAAEQAAAR